MARTGDTAIVIGNASSVTFFIFYYSLALANRKTAAFHKRFMLFAALSLMLPALARWAYVFDLNIYVVLPTWLTLLLAIPAYNLIRERNIKPATAIGLGGFALHLAALILTTPPPEGH